MTDFDPPAPLTNPALRNPAMPLDCRACGACCIGQNIPLFFEDVVPVAMSNGHYMRHQGGRCTALRGRLGIDVSCSIYDQRPAVCRLMKAGSTACLRIRQNMSFPTNESK